MKSDRCEASLINQCVCETVLMTQVKCDQCVTVETLILLGLVVVLIYSSLL